MPIYKGEDGKVLYPDWVGGMCMVIRSKDFMELGGFDERYFMYGEDVDICLRAWSKSKTVAIDTDNHVIHEAQRFAEKTSVIGYGIFEVFCVFGLPIIVKIRGAIGDQRMVKRTIDIIFSLIAILFLAIPMLGLALGVRLQSAGPVLFWSERVGRCAEWFFSCQSFEQWTSALRWHLHDKLESPKSYITPFGSMIRRYSLDELPQIFSVLRGDMSLVGPRPMLPMMK